MNISNDTLNILKNFSQINKSIVINPGNEISTLAVTKNILASAKVKESFDSTISIYDLSEFIATFSLFKNPEFDFSNNQFMVISDKGSKTSTQFFYADPSVITSAPEKKITIPSVDVEFTINDSDLDTLIKASRIHNVTDLCLVGDGESIRMVVKDKKNDTSNNFSMVVGETQENFCFYFKVENLKLLPGNYNVKVSKTNVSLFTSTNGDLEYYIALEPDSTFG
jgi:hypothetical protein